ncbi:MAG: hypothetical protein EPN20_16720 [Magnetospirillum sp.]|nr:MAG: hypothetical protein EPN20_16720 [Magnetospirillum sp.]
MRLWPMWCVISKVPYPSREASEVEKIPSVWRRKRSQHGDRINAILSGAGHNVRLLLKWLRLLLCLILGIMRTISRERQVMAVPA